MSNSRPTCGGKFTNLPILYRQVNKLVATKRARAFETTGPDPPSPETGTIRKVGLKSRKKREETARARCEEDADCHTFVLDDEETRQTDDADEAGLLECPRQARPPECDVGTSSVDGPDGLASFGVPNLEDCDHEEFTDRTRPGDSDDRMHEHEHFEKMLRRRSLGRAVSAGNRSGSAAASAGALLGVHYSPLSYSPRRPESWCSWPRG